MNNFLTKTLFSAIIGLMVFGPTMVSAQEVTTLSRNGNIVGFDDRQISSQASFVARLKLWKSDTVYNVCGGTAVHEGTDKKIISAAHCMYENGEAKFIRGEAHFPGHVVHFTPDNVGGNINIGVEGDWSDDIAVVDLVDDSTIPTISIWNGSYSGVVMISTSTEAKKNNEKTTVITSTVCNVWAADVGFDLRNDCDHTAGSSGGGAFVISGAELSLVAVVSRFENTKLKDGTLSAENISYLTPVNPVSK